MGLIYVSLWLQSHVLILIGFFVWLSLSYRSSVSSASAASFSSMAKANFRTSRGKTVSTAHSIKGSKSGIFHLKRKQQRPGSFNRIASSYGTSDLTCLFTMPLTSSSSIIYFWGTCLLIVLLPLLSSTYPIALDTSMPTRHSPRPGTCTALMFLPLNLNGSTTERWTERLIFFISFWSKMFCTRSQKRSFFDDLIKVIKDFIPPHHDILQPAMKVKKLCINAMRNAFDKYIEESCLGHFQS